MPLIVVQEPGRTPWDLKFPLFGVPIRIHPAYWLISLLLCYRASTKDFSLVLVAMACMFVSILVHEFGHIYCQKHYGDRGNYIVFWWLGGLAVPSENAPGFWPRVWISFWGPLAGFIFGAICYIIGGIMYAWDFPWASAYYGGSIHLQYAFDNLFWFNIAWGMMNLMPVLPLDGGNILKAVGERKRRPQSWPYQVGGYVGIAVFAVNIAVALFLPSVPFLGDLYIGVFFLLLGVQCLYFAWQIKRMGDFGEMGESQFERREAWEQDPDWWKK